MSQVQKSDIPMCFFKSKMNDQKNDKFHLATGFFVAFRALLHMLSHCLFKPLHKLMQCAICLNTILCFYFMEEDCK